MNRFVQKAGCTARTKLEGEEEAYLQELKSGMVWLDGVYETAKKEAADLVRFHSDVFVVVFFVFWISDDSFSLHCIGACRARGCSALRIADLTSSEIAEIKKKLLRPSTCSSSSDHSATYEEANLYQLFSIIMHRGTAYSGHYFAYIRDHLGEGNWSGATFEELIRQAKVTHPPS